MTDCVFCIVHPIICKEADAYIVSAPVPTTNHYLRFNNTDTNAIGKDEFTTLKTFTPGARIKLTLTEAEEVLNHKNVWKTFLESKSYYGIVFNNTKDAENTELITSIETKTLPRDWDILVFGQGQYVFNKRAARILYSSCRQIHNNLTNFLSSFSVLQIVNL